MKAISVTAYKHPLAIGDVADPTPGPRDVVVAIQAAGLNQLDEKIRLGEFKQILPYKAPFVLGHDLAGTVESVGSAVTGLTAGDVVYARPRDGRIGTFAERIAVDADDVALAPRSISVAEAASLPLVGLTAWQVLVQRGHLTAGQRVLIHAGSGGVGTIAIQLAKHLGATVTTTVSATNADLVRSLGADVVIDYRSQDFGDLVEDQDLVLDSLGGANLEKSLRVLRPGGKAVGIAGPPDPAFAAQAGLNPAVRLAVAGLSAKTRRQAKKHNVSYEFHFMHASGSQLTQLAQLVDNQVLRPVLGRTIAFDDIPTAVTTPGNTPGKIVATLTD